VALWGQAGSADVAGAASRIAEIRAALESYPAERIYNLDETSLFYRCIPNQAYVQAGQRLQARGTKAMKAKERITPVLACNATGNHNIPVAIIGKAKEPLCFKPPRRPSPLPFFSQKSAWMDSDIFKPWFETIFLPAVRARTTQPVALVSDNCGAHDQLERNQVKFIALPPNCTFIVQPPDLGIIACLKRRYKRRLLDLFVSAFEATLGARAAANPPPPAGTDAPASDAVAAPGQFPTARSSTVVASAATAPGGAAFGEPIGTERAGEAPPKSTSLAVPSFGPWLVADGRWTPVNDQSPSTRSAAQIADLSAARRAARIGVLRASRSAVRRAARIAVRRAARSAERRAARLAVRRAAPNSASGVAGGGTSGAVTSTGAASAAAAAATGSANNRPAVAAGPGIWGRPSDWHATPVFLPLNRRRSRVRAALAEIGGVRDGAVATLQDASEIVRDE